jgi:hypothetical protein
MGELIRQQEEKDAGRMIDIARLMKKVEIHLSREQLSALNRMMGSYLTNLDLYSIADKAIFYQLYQVYESKIRKKQFSLKHTFKLSLDVSQAWAMVSMIQEMPLAAWPYEYQLGQFIISEIDHQTV